MKRIANSGPIKSEFPARIHLDRTARGHRHHRDPCGDTVADLEQGESQGAGCRCLSNVKQLQLAWQLYADDKTISFRQCRRGADHEPILVCRQFHGSTGG